MQGILVDLVGIEPTTYSMPWKRAPSCATGQLSQSSTIIYFRSRNHIRQTIKAALYVFMVKRAVPSGNFKSICQRFSTTRIHVSLNPYAQTRSETKLKCTCDNRSSKICIIRAAAFKISYPGIRLSTPSRKGTSGALSKILRLLL